MRRLGGQSAIDSINASLSKAVTAATASQGSAQTPSVPAYNGSTVTWSTQPFTDLQLQTVNATTSVSTGSVSAGVVNCTTSVAAPTADIRDLTVTTDHDLTIQAPTGRAVLVAHNGSQNAERVMTVPAADYDSQPLVAGSTYELVHDAALGFRFRLRTGDEYVFYAEKDGAQSFSDNVTTTLHGFRVRAQKNTGFSVNAAVLPSPNGEWTCPGDGLYSINFELQVYSSNARMYQVYAQIYVGTTLVREQTESVKDGTSSDDFKYFATTCSTIQDLTQNDTVSFKVKGRNYNTSSSMSLNDGIATVVRIVRVG